MAQNKKKTLCICCILKEMGQLGITIKIDYVRMIHLLLLLLSSYDPVIGAYTRLPTMMQRLGSLVVLCAKSVYALSML